MSNSFEICFNLDITEPKDILNDYFGVVLRDEYLVNVIFKSGRLLGEVIDKSIGDTCARELLIEEVIKSLPNSTGQEWPTYGTPKADADKFYAWFSEAIKTVGGTFGAE